MDTANLAAMKEAFRAAPYIAALGMELESIGAGECVTGLAVRPDHPQQNGFVHAGVLGAMADHTAGAAAATRAPEGSHVLTAEFKLSLLRAARGETLTCRARVLKSGRQLAFVEADVFCGAADAGPPVARASATMAIVAATGR